MEFLGEKGNSDEWLGEGHWALRSEAGILDIMHSSVRRYFNDDSKDQ